VLDNATRRPLVVRHTGRDVHGLSALIPAGISRRDEASGTADADGDRAGEPPRHNKLFSARQNMRPDASITEAQHAASLCGAARRTAKAFDKGEGGGLCHDPTESASAFPPFCHNIRGGVHPLTRVRPLFLARVIRRQVVALSSSATDHPFRSSFFLPVRISAAHRAEFRDHRDLGSIKRGENVAALCSVFERLA